MQPLLPFLCSVTETVSVSSSYGGGEDEDQALLDRMAKREERRQRRMKEALERQKQLEGDHDVPVEKSHPEEEEEEERPSWRRGRYRNYEEEEEKTVTYNSRREEKEEVEAAPEEEEELKEEIVEDKPRKYLREQRDGFKLMCLIIQLRINCQALACRSATLSFCLHTLIHVLRLCPSRSSVRSPEASAGDEQDDAARLEAERKLEELKRRRDDAESEEFERMRQKQQEAEAELEELKRKREERKKVLEEEERQKKQEEEERKAKEEEEKKKMKEEIERRRAEAAEKRNKVDDTEDSDDKPFKCVSPRGSSLKVSPSHLFTTCCSETHSSTKASHSPVVSKIDNRLEQYTSARENKESRSPRSGVVDLPMATDSLRNIKSMWEKGNVFSSPGGGGSTFKEAAVMKTGVAGRINDWLNKTPESNKSGGKPSVRPLQTTSLLANAILLLVLKMSDTQMLISNFKR
uniref:Caldesmon 1 n=1 Tax=Gouania willdenowi TaxID=441366 RepID=A0A8C5HBV3_GOUWI